MGSTVILGAFEWDLDKDAENILKHGVSFETATQVFNDPCRFIDYDKTHSAEEPRWFCVGEVRGETLTVRFTHRNVRIRIIGAGYWRKGKRTYEKEKKAAPY